MFWRAFPLAPTPDENVNNKHSHHNCYLTVFWQSPFDTGLLPRCFRPFPPFSALFRTYFISRCDPIASAPITPTTAITAK